MGSMGRMCQLSRISGLEETMPIPTHAVTMQAHLHRRYRSFGKCAFGSIFEGQNSGTIEHIPLCIHVSFHLPPAALLIRVTPFNFALRLQAGIAAIVEFFSLFAPKVAKHSTASPMLARTVELLEALPPRAVYLSTLRWSVSSMGYELTTLISSRHTSPTQRTRFFAIPEGVIIGNWKVHFVFVELGKFNSNVVLVVGSR